MTAALSISALRADRGLTLAQMGELVGLSKSQMHEVERTGRASLRVAVAIEELSGGRIDAASLSEDVRLSRESLAAVHALPGSPPAPGAATGLSGELSGGEAA